jgi:hypothetical protein
VVSEELLESNGSSLFQGVDALDQAKDVGGHNEEVARRIGTGIPVGVGRSTRNQDGGAGSGFHVLIANLHTQGAFQHVPGFIVGAMEVPRSDEPRRARRATGVSPFGDHERIVGRTQGASGKGWCDCS